MEEGGVGYHPRVTPGSVQTMVQNFRPNIFRMGKRREKELDFDASSSDEHTVLTDHRAAVRTH
jgi:hypothetical protein